MIELLPYRDAAQPSGSGGSFAEPRDHMSPAYPRSMRICFHVRDDVDFNLFIAQDHRIPPSIQRMMAKRTGGEVVEIDSCHAVMLSHPREVTAFIEKAATGGQ
ncbi:hypothetical protein [Sphingomonas sp.]|uniref:alpha/beta fold hydrolase n=1 Tax=Sphingomonas sp. TaxID=28214 RepID=UPI0025CE22B7|nr:hypothetical protein [Sphingomonas sp.]